ncbi:MAG: D-amino acid dehydrogenase [Casimicrobiaceae bacterium]
MHIAVLGAGVIGVTAAWYLAGEGHAVTVVDRQPAAARETSFANGGQIAASHAEPWANPHAPAKILQWLGQEDAPLLFRLRMDPAQWRWGLRFLRECLPARTRRNTLACLRLALYSRAQLAALRASTGIEYDGLQRGILAFHTDAEDFRRDAAAAALLRAYGGDQVPQSPDACIAIEPALASLGSRLAGGIYSASDESGDAHRFTTALAARAREAGVAFAWDTVVEGLSLRAGRVVAARCTQGGTRFDLAADAFVVALGSYAPLLLRPVGIDIPVYPVKGYSATITVGDHRGAPVVSLTDPAAKIVISRLGNRLRAAGTAELNGYDLAPNPVRSDALVARVFDLFPDAGERGSVTTWTGLRPATPSNVPIIGRSRVDNLFLDTGHGTLGWTMACGSGRALADIVAGRVPSVDFPFGSGAS